MEDRKQEKQKIRTSTKWAIAVTVVWLGGVAAYVFFKWDNFLSMDPNAIGDFLAGTMSPLALFWLVAGYRQQGEALRLNTDEIKLQREALLLQHQELAEQVKATLKVATHSEQQAEVTKAMYKFNLDEAKRISEERRLERLKQIRPGFLVKMGQRSTEQWNINLQNIGFTAYKVKVTSTHFEDVSVLSDTSIFPGDTAWHVRLNKEKPYLGFPFMEIECCDIDGNVHVAYFQFDEANNRIDLTDHITP